MGDKLIIGPINKGLKTDRTAFVIDNDSFPTLINAYQWRGRVKRKRGTSFLGRLTRFFNSTSISYNTGSTTITLNGSGVGDLFAVFSLQTNGNIVPGSITLTGPGGPFTDPTQDGFLTPTGTGGPNTIDYATGIITIPAQVGSAYTAVFRYYPDLPVMGLEDFIRTTEQFAGCIAFDTKYSYNISTVDPFPIYDVSFYKNPQATAALPGYVQKTNSTPTTWNGQDYQQFWTVNYEGALWTTNGMNLPFVGNGVGMQYKSISAIGGIVAGPPAFATLNIVAHGLVVGDFVFINEVGGMTGINFQTGYVTVVVDANNVTVEFPFATLGGAYTSGGIAQYLTNRSDPTVDCLRFYDGDPTNTNPTIPVLNGVRGWVNFAPPLSQSNFSIADLPAAQYYLVGARMIQAFKDRLVFLGPIVQTSTPGSQVYLRDTVVYSQNGTPYYTASFTGNPDAITTVFHPILVPDNQIATAPAYFADQTGFGGNITAGTAETIVTSSSNEDVLILGFTSSQAKLVYSGNDIVPFNFFLINTEYGASSTFSAINMDEGVLTSGSRGFVITNQTSSTRFDLDIPDQIFQIMLKNNGQERVCSQRDFITEWVYFTYASNMFTPSFPTQTLQYNYRDHSWGIFNESYTTYGLFRQTSGYTWATIGNVFKSWEKWNEPWNAGSTTLLQQQTIAGNQQGFVVFRDDGTNESISLTIQSFSGNTVTSPNHCLNFGDFIIINGCLGTVSSQVNGKIFQVDSPVTANTFTLDPLISAGTYLGNGNITRMYVPQIQTKQFPVAWSMARKTRIGPQQYLLTKTAVSQITLQIFLSQNGASPYNINNNALVNSSVLYTCPESTNLGLTPANINLQMVTAQAQEYIWHRKNISLIGDTIQLGFTLSPEQMSSFTAIGTPATITGATPTYPCVLAAINNFNAGEMLRITGVVGMTELNFDAINNNYYQILSASSTSVTIDVDATGFTAYDSGGIAQPVDAVNQFAEIELHSIVMDVQPSQVLA